MGGPTWRGGCRAVRQFLAEGGACQAWPGHHLRGLLEVGLVCCSSSPPHPPASTWRQPWAPRMFAERVLGALADGGRQSGLLPHYCQQRALASGGQRKQNRSVREKRWVSTGMLRALGPADWLFHAARDAESKGQGWSLLLGAAKAQSGLTDQAVRVSFC